MIIVDSNVCSTLLRKTHEIIIKKVTYLYVLCHFEGAWFSFVCELWMIYQLFDIKYEKTLAKS